MSMIIEQTPALVRVLCKSRIVSISLTSFLQEKFTVTNGFDGELDALVPCCSSGHHGIEVVFFRSKERISNDGLYEEYNKLGLIPDPIAHAAVVCDLPVLINKPSITQWTYRARDAYFSPFICLENRLDRLTAIVDHAERAYLWDPGTWFCGVKPMLAT